MLYFYGFTVRKKHLIRITTACRLRLVIDTTRASVGGGNRGWALTTQSLSEQESSGWLAYLPSVTRPIQTSCQLIKPSALCQVYYLRAFSLTHFSRPRRFSAEGAM